MNTEKNKQENKKALKILVPITIGAGICGGIIGGVSVTQGAQGLAANFAHWLHEFLFIVGPWAVIIISLIGVVGGLYIYNSAKKEYEDNLPSDAHDEIEESVFEELDHKISVAILLISITMIVSFMFFAIIVAYMDRYIEGSWILLLVTFVAFIASIFGEAKIQQLLVDFTKVLYPQKNGSVYDIKFSEKWEDSCDELEKLMIYKAAYKSYKTTNGACCTALVAMILLSFFFHYGPLPAMLVGCIWLTQVVSYYMEAMKLEKEQIN